MAQKKLTPKKIDTIISMFKEGKTHREIAAVVKCNPLTVGRYIHRFKATSNGGTKPEPKSPALDQSQVMAIKTRVSPEWQAWINAGIERHYIKTQVNEFGVAELTLV